MKTKFAIFILFICGLLAACYEDDSNLEIKEINPLVIDLGGTSPSISVFLLDTLEIAPIVYKVGVEDADLSYKWEISGNDIVPQVLDTTMILKAVISVPEKSDAYTLLLTVTDNTTGLQNYEEFKVTVSAVLSQGLLVADTKDEQHSDLNLIVSANFRGGAYFNQFNEKNTKTLTSVYSQCNAGQLINGLVTQMLAPGDGRESERTLTVITDREMLRMDPHDYLLQGKNNDYFYVHVPEDRFKPEWMTYEDTQYHEMMMVDGVVYIRDTRWGNLNYGAPLETSDYSEYEVHMGYGYSDVAYPNYRYVYFYDEKNDRFLETQDYTNLLVNSKCQTNLGKQKAIYMGEGDKGLMYTVFQSPESGNLLLYTFQPGNAYYGTDYETRTTYHLNACTDIKNARKFQSSSSENVLYYATGRKIYAVLLTEENPGAHECFDVQDLAPLGNDNLADEEITSILIWKKANQGTIKIKDSDGGEGSTKISAQNRMMVVTLWNKTTGKGKIVTMPIMNQGAGVLEKDTGFWKEYSGFGRILSIEPQAWI